MIDILLTIFTPTYNRAYILPILYKSLVNQTNKEFTWLVVDDGSTDNTEKLIKNWIKEGNIRIKYIKQENQGKHIAYNTGLDNCDTELFSVVDSDDYLLENAVEDILYDYENYVATKNKVFGLISIRIYKNHKPIGGFFMPENVDYCKTKHLSEKYNVKGDCVLSGKTAILRKYKFPKIEGEKFIGEQYIYSMIDRDYEVYVSKKTFYVGEYRDDGYTNNMFKLIYDNPKGYMLLKQKKLENSVDSSFFVKYKQASLYTVGCWLSKENFLKDSPSKFYSIISIPLAMAVYFFRFSFFNRYILKNRF